MNVRSVTQDDIEALRTLFGDDEEHFYGRPSQLSGSGIHDWLSLADLSRDSWLYEENGAVCAAAWAFRPPESELAIGVGAVHPRRKGCGLGAELAERVEASAAALGVERIHQNALAPDGAAAALFGGRGYRKARRFYEMAVELAEPPTPTGLVVEPLPAGEERAFHAALDEAFQDHWEHRSTPFEQWWERHAAKPDFDRSLWFVIRDGGEIAAAARNEANRNGGGYVGAIGVRRPHRGKGYAKALLLHTFGEFYDRGMPRVTLGVDAENPTGATHLYERVGMHVELEVVVYEKALR
jgi:ribosomal protein S18 acetylase RimI-like enzyme